MNRPTYLKVTCHLMSPVAGEIPMLDALLLYQMAVFEGKLKPIRRDEPLPPFGEIHIPILLRRIGGVAVPACSSPIARVRETTVEHFGKRLAVEHAGLLKQKEQKIVAVTNNIYKSYHLPLKVQRIDKIVWYCIGKRRPILQALKRVKAIGRKRSQGYGLVAGWEAEYIDYDYSWYIKSDEGIVLMRPLPVCDELPEDLIGYQHDYGAVQPPYWHPDRYMERVIPC